MVRLRFDAPLDVAASELPQAEQSPIATQRN
jgi:hypothetical protein